MSSSGRSNRSTRGLSAAHTPTASPIATAIAVATSTWDAVSIAGSQTPMIPIASSMSASGDRGSQAADDQRDRREPGDRHEPRHLHQEHAHGSSAYSTRKLPIGSVIPKMNDAGSCT